MSFTKRHIGPSDSEVSDMLSYLGFSSIDDLIQSTIPNNILSKESLEVGPGLSEFEFLKKSKA